MYMEFKELGNKYFFSLLVYLKTRKCLISQFLDQFEMKLELYCYITLMEKMI